ncbi:hypothetical protein G6F46_014713 [Rhizopus delemar]|nr:hypothetical protein G6F46_014713 [Rhizopus delemar]
MPRPAGSRRAQGAARSGARRHAGHLRRHPHARRPAAGGQDGLGIVLLDQRSHCVTLVPGLQVVGLGNPVTDPVAQVVGLLRTGRVVVQPRRQVGAVEVECERAFDMHFAAASPRGMAAIAHVAGNHTVACGSPGSKSGSPG